MQGHASIDGEPTCFDWRLHHCLPRNPCEACIYLYSRWSDARCSSHESSNCWCICSGNSWKWNRCCFARWSRRLHLWWRNRSSWFTRRLPRTASFTPTFPCNCRTLCTPNSCKQCWINRIGSSNCYEWCRVVPINGNWKEQGNNAVFIVRTCC